MNPRTKQIFDAGVCLFLTFILFLSGCTSELDRGNPKLDYVLVQLVQAEKRGEAESFAGQHGLKLENGKVAVSIRFAPSQAETAAKAVTSASGELVSSLNSQIGFDALVPIASLEALANETSILIIERANPGELGN